MTIKRVLVIEDEEDAAQVYKSVLTTAGFDVDVVLNPLDAFELIKQNKYDVISTDIVMPEMDGLTLLATIMKDFKKYNYPKVGILSNIGGDLAIEKAKTLGALEYIIPSDSEPEDLVEYINKLISAKPQDKFYKERSKEAAEFLNIQLIQDSSKPKKLQSSTLINVIKVTLIIAVILFVSSKAWEWFSYNFTNNSWVLIIYTDKTQQNVYTKIPDISNKSACFEKGAQLINRQQAFECGRGPLENLDYGITVYKEICDQSGDCRD